MTEYAKTIHFWSYDLGAEATLFVQTFNSDKTPGIYY